MSAKRRWRFAAVPVAIVVSTSGCAWSGLNSVRLPGAEGTGPDSYTVYIQMPNVTTLTQNSPVRVNDVTVGSVQGIEVQDWHALVTVSIEDAVVLPANATAKIGQTSLLGSNHVELAAPIDQPAEGRLQGGDTIPLDRAGAYPTTEQTLSSLSVVLNGGGFAQLQDVTRELNAALDGRETDAHDLLPRLNELTTSLDEQRGDIVSALDGLDRVSVTFAREKDTLARALEGVPPALEVLNAQSGNLTDALVSLGRLSDVANRIIDESGDDLKANLRSLVPVLESLANTGNHLTDVLTLLLTFPFSMKNMDHWLKGDYANLMMMLDLTGARLDSNFLTGTPLGGTFGGVEGLLGRVAGVAGHAGNPLASPPVPPPPGLPQIPGLPALPALPGLPELPQIPGINAPLPGVPGP
ncbi:MCE family protein [Antrihabitans sp. YC2-6]|uniref:MCE family protein n=1 Tax=Antrihabitans sp. YC2-6 TaxID=2799498 RepID=UPI0018F2BCB9|nr:MCE family protein [Antrihabitans sp. YC2-6]MBJ8345761.1 MCE family protein [Antrihabitans sp. YC2-6]